MTMEYWRGVMNWPLDPTWTCETCNAHSFIDGTYLEWGLANGECRCSRCQHIYTMKDGDGNCVVTPISCVKDRYKQAAKYGWEQWHTPMGELTREQWAVALKAIRKAA